MKVEIGHTIRIIWMDGEPQYSGKTGIVERIDDIGQLHGSWGGCALIPGKDCFEVIKNEENIAISRRVEIEKMAHLSGACDHPDRHCLERFGDCNECSVYSICENLFNAGYGNVENAINEFAEKLYDKLESAAMCFGRDPERDAGVYLTDIKQAIKELLEEEKNDSIRKI